MIDYSGNTDYDISGVHYDSNWKESIKRTDNNIISFTPSYLFISSSEQPKFNDLFPNSNIQIYKKIYLEPYRKITGTNHRVWAAYDISGNNLLENAINYNFANDGSYLPILEYYKPDGVGGFEWTQINMFEDPLFWLMDDVNGTITFFNTDASLNE